MIIKTLASSSSGNCYVIQGLTESIMIEAGIPIKKIKQGLNYDMSNISCCLLSHEHMDHAKAIKDIIAMGKTVYSSNGTFEALNIKNHFAVPVKEREIIETEEFIIKPFSTQHDCAEPFGFLIESKIELKRVVFATDTYFLKYAFRNIDVFMIEVNYIESVLNQAVESGGVPEAGANRVRKSHMSLERVTKFFDSMVEKGTISNVKKIIPIHISSRFGNAEAIQLSLQDRFNVEVVIGQEEVVL